MRVLFLPLAALALAAPAHARDHDRPPEERLAERLNDPVLQDRVAAAMSAMFGAVLDLRIGEFERAIDPRSRAPRDETLRDRALSDDPGFEERMADRTRAMTGTVGAMASRLAVLMPGLRAAVADMADQIEDSRDRVPPRRDYDYDDWDD